MSASDPSLENLIELLPADKQADLKRLLYGAPVAALPIPQAAHDAVSSIPNAELQLFKTNNPHPDTMRPAQTVRIACVQNSIVLPTTAPLLDQYKAIEAKTEKLIDAAAAMGANVLCLQEAWNGPFFYCTREKRPWLELAQDAEKGLAAQFISRKAAQHNMVIVSPILERDYEHGETIWNTAVVFSNTGLYLGKHRKNHIPRVGDFNESTYYFEGNTGHPVFETQFGRIAINICYGRHHPLNWMMFGLNGAQIVFNPSATVGGLSEPLWPIEARNAAIANTYFVGAINRVGNETYPNEYTSGDGQPAHKEFGFFYGSSYVANPDGSRTPGLSRNRDGVVVNEVDLNMTTAIRDRWTFQMTARYDMYAEGLTNYVKHDFKPQRIGDPSLKE